MPLRGLGVFERVDEACAIHRFLLDAIDDLRLWNANQLEDGRRDVNAWVNWLRI